MIYEVEGRDGDVSLVILYLCAERQQAERCRGRGGGRKKRRSGSERGRSDVRLLPHRSTQSMDHVEFDDTTPPLRPAPRLEPVREHPLKRISPETPFVCAHLANEHADSPLARLDPK